MFIKLDELKSLITASAADSVLLMYINYVEERIISYCKDNFLNSEIKYSSNDLIFNDSDNKITGPSADFIETGFRTEDIIYISGSFIKWRFLKALNLPRLSG